MQKVTDLSIFSNCKSDLIDVARKYPQNIFLITQSIPEGMGEETLKIIEKMRYIGNTKLGILVFLWGFDPILIRDLVKKNILAIEDTDV